MKTAESLPKREFVVARVGIAMMRVTEAAELLQMAMTTFADPDEDISGEDRSETLENALLSCHEAATAIGIAREMMGSFSEAEQLFSEDSLDTDDE